MTTTQEPAHRTSIRAFRAGAYVLIVAKGELPTPGHDVDIVPSLLRIFPQQYNLVQRPRPGIWPQVVTPYRYREAVPFPADQPVVTVHHAEGSDEVTIEKAGRELAAYTSVVAGEEPVPEGTDEATGFSKNLSFDEAFKNALANLPPLNQPNADQLERVQVLEIGGLFGGFPGFRDLFVRVRRTAD